MRATGARNLAGVQSRPKVADSQAGFGGGLNTTASDDNLAPNQVRQCSNGILSQFGDATKRLGTRRLHSAAIAAQPVRNGFCWRSATTHEYLVACDGTLYSGGVYAANMTWTSKGALSSSSVYPSFRAFRDSSSECAYIADGALRKYTGGAQSSPAGTPAVKVLEVYNQRLFGITGSDQTLYYSALNDGDTLGTASGGSAVVRTFSAQKITGLLNLGASLAIFHVTGVSRFTGYTQDDIAIGAGTSGISTDVGTIAPHSMIAVDGLGFFMSERGAYMINDGGVQRMDSVRSPDPTVAVVANLAVTDLANIDVTYDKATRTIRWAIPGSGVYLYHLPLNAWSGPWNGPGYTTVVTHCLFDGINDNGLPITLVGGEDGFVRHADYVGTYKDNVLYDGSGGSVYTLTLQCRRMYTNHPEADKAWRWAYLFADLRGTVTAGVSWASSTGTGSYTLPSTSSSLWGSATWGSFTWGGAGAEPFRIPISKRGTFIDFTITDDGEAESVYSRLTVEGFDYGRRG